VIVVEVVGALAGASVTVAAMSLTSYGKRFNENRDAVVRLTTSVDNMIHRLDVLHKDIKLRDAEVFARLRDLEAAVARLEGSQKHS